MQPLIKIAARRSLLSQAQVKEVQSLMQNVSPCVFESIFLDSRGDLDLQTPLNSLAKTDFFTLEIDSLVKQDLADIAIHSAKDLPYPLDEDLELICLTEGQDPRDSFVSFHYTIETLPRGGTVGVCSDRRIQAIKELRPDCVIKSIRGPIDLRIQKMKEGDYDALILAEAGLLRLNLDVPRQILDIPVAPHQGQLAIVAKKNRDDLKSLFKPLESRICG